MGVGRDRNVDEAFLTSGGLRDAPRSLPSTFVTSFTRASRSRGHALSSRKQIKTHDPQDQKKTSAQKNAGLVIIITPRGSALCAADLIRR